MRKERPPVGERVYQLKITLKHIRPPIWRRLQVRGDITLGQLHRFLQVAMGWSDSHLHLFRIGRTEYTQPYPEEDLFSESKAKDEDEAILGEVVRSEKHRFIYVYDYGDHWEHDIVVEKILPREGEMAHPICLAGRRACPPEDCGGPWGYGGMLQALSDPSHPEHETYTEWLGGGFDPEEFDLEELNRRLSSPDTYRTWED
jgi:hypothetical protein